MRVMKFGGTSVGTVESLRNVKKIVEGSTGPQVVVVSALGGVTDMLIRGARQALKGSNDCFDTWEAIVGRHKDVVFSELIAEQEQPHVWHAVEKLLERLRNYYRGIMLLEDLSEHTLCNVVSLGERMSSLIVSRIIKAATLFQSMEFVKTERWFGKNIADTQLTDSLIRKTFADMPTRVAIAPGFISTDRDSGEITNLGRGGSDYTAALVAASLGADVLDIWTDVDGFMTADPRIIKEAKVIEHLSFLESMDLCNFGAKVIYPPTIYPVFHKNIPIRILNTFNPEAPGTIITDAHKATNLQLFRGVTSIAEASVITVEARTGASLSPLNTRVLNVLSKQGVEVLLSTSAADTRTISLALRRTDARRAMQALREDFAGEATEAAAPAIAERSDVSAVSAVGENLKLHPETTERLLDSLLSAEIPVLAGATGASGFTFTVVVPEQMHHHALRALHALI